MKNYNTADSCCFATGSLILVTTYRQPLHAAAPSCENQRQVFIWNELEDMTLQEIADKTNEKLKTVISRKGYAVKHLRLRLADLYNELNNL